MTHYTAEEWKSYKNRSVDEDIRRQMEIHMDRCDMCSEIYLSLFDAPDLAEAELYIPDEFAADVIDLVRQEAGWKTVTKGKNKNRCRRSMFAYYLAAGLLTLFLTGSGFFNAMGNFDSLVRYDEPQKEKVMFSDIITGSMNQWMDSYESGNTSEIINNGGDNQ